MAASFFPTVQYTSENFVESAGVIPFHPSKKQICLLHYPARNEWLLAKGRRNCGESRHQTALREVHEETGLRCRLLPVKMATRAPPAIEVEDTLDAVRTYDDVMEPFMVTIRQLDGGNRAKIIYWYVGTINEESMSEGVAPEERFEIGFFGHEEALQKLSFASDREVLRTAIRILEATMEDVGPANQ